MKKIILLILLIPTYVYAEIFYTNYYETNEIEESDLVKIEEKYLYRNYKIIRENAKYYEKDTQPYYAPYIDENDYIETFQAYQEPINNEPLNTIFKIKNINKIRYLKFRDFYAKEAIIKNIKIYYNNEEINYSFYSNNYDFYSKLIRENEIIIDLEKDYELNKIEIKFDITNNNFDRIAFMLNVYEKSPANITEYSYYTIDISKGRKNENYTINFYDSKEYENIIKEKMSWINESKINELESVNYYKKNIILYKYYNTRKVITLEYTEKPMDGYLLDYEDYIIETKYYKRDYIEVKDDYNNENNSLELIINSNIPTDQIKLNLILNENIKLVIEYKDNIFYKEYKTSQEINIIPQNNYKQIMKLESQNLKSKKENVIYQTKDNNKKEENKQIKTTKITTIPNKTNKTTSSHASSVKIKITNKENIKITTTKKVKKTNMKKVEKNNYYWILILLLLFIIYKNIQKKKN